MGSQVYEDRFPERFIHMQTSAVPASTDQMAGHPVGFFMVGNPELGFVVSKVGRGNVLGCNQRRYHYWTFQSQSRGKIDSESYCELLNKHLTPWLEERPLALSLWRTMFSSKIMPPHIGRRIPLTGLRKLALITRE